jgi:hypothetical protein
MQTWKVKEIFFFSVESNIKYLHKFLRVCEFMIFINSSLLVSLEV